MHELRQYWRLHCHPVWLFPRKPEAGQPWCAAKQPIDDSTLQKAFAAALKGCGIQKQASIHTLRHLKYLASYVFRVAISNNRIEKLAKDTVTYRYNDSASGQTRRCTVPVNEFIRRFLQHVLPKGFVKVRYYGFFAPGNRRLLAQVRCLLGASAKPVTQPAPTAAVVTASPALCCPTCGQPLRWVETFPRRPLIRAPPG